MTGQAGEVRGTTALLERDEELEGIDAVLGPALAGSGALIVIEGPAGIGKTELLLAARQRAADAGMTLASARGSELERPLAFGVVRQLLEPAVAAADPGLRSELFAGAATLAEPLLAPETIAEMEPGPGQEVTFAALHGLYWLCANLAHTAPLCLAVDDAHWADLASLRLLAYLAPRLEGLPLALVVAARPAEAPTEEELLVRLTTDPAAHTMAPAPLTTDAVATLLRDGLEQDPAPSFAYACHEATGGTPFLMRELIRELREQGVQPAAAASEQVAGLGPRMVARGVVARVRRLGPAAERLAAATAVLGSDAEPHRAFLLAGVEEETAADALDGLSAAGVLVRGRPIEFAHPIVRAAVYAELAAGERSRLHRRAASQLADEGAAEERIASHLLATEPSADRQSVALLRRTAGSALARGAPASAASYLERALAEPPAPSELAEVLHLLGAAKLAAGDPVASGAYLEEAHRLSQEGSERLRIARELANALSIQGRIAAAAEVIAGILADSADLDTDLALALRADLLMLTQLGPPAQASGQEGSLAEPEPALEGDSPGVRKYLAFLALGAAMDTRPAAEVRELGSRARDAGIVEELAAGAIAWNQVIHPVIHADAFDLAERMLDDAFEHLREHPSVVGLARAYMARSLLRHRQGALREALADGWIAVETGREIGFSGLLYGLSLLVDSLVEHGEPATADATLADMGWGAEIPDAFAPNDRLLESRAWLRLVQDRTADAIADFEEFARRCERRAFIPSMFDARSGLAVARLRSGDPDRARALAAQQLELSRRWGAPRTVGRSLRILGLCLGDDRGLGLLRESADVLADSGARLEHAHSLVELGAAIRRSGSRSAAREPLHAGMELAHRCGARPLVERAREELLVSGARPRRIMRTGVDALTPSELRVTRMAAEGMTNREIAQALFVTQRTIEGHLTHAFQKLDITSRGELGERLAADA